FCQRGSPDIPTITFEVDPRLVIPLCAIQLQNEINLTQLSSFKNELESVSIENLAPKIEFVNRVLNKITPKQRWLYLFNSLTTELQFTLLSCLINYRRPHQNDWRNLFKKIEYQFKKGGE
ncbi:membrane protein, partial [Microcystis aeruginosa NIES-88]